MYKDTFYSKKREERIAFIRITTTNPHKCFLFFLSKSDIVRNKFTCLPVYLFGDCGLRTTDNETTRQQVDGAYAQL